MGLVPWVHADLAGGFLQVAKSALGQVQVDGVVWKKEHGDVRQLSIMHEEGAV